MIFFIIWLCDRKYDIIQLYQSGINWIYELLETVDRRYEEVTGKPEPDPDTRGVDPGSVADPDSSLWMNRAGCTIEGDN